MPALLQLSLVLLLVVLNGIFVSVELALVSIRKTRIEALIRQKRHGAKLLKIAHNNLQSYIILTQLGNTAASLVLGWYGERILSETIGRLKLFNHPLNSFFQVGMVTAIALAVLTLTHLIFGELVPKSIAFQRPESHSLFFIKPLTLLMNICKPVIKVLDQAVEYIARFINRRSAKQEQHLSSEEMEAIFIESVRQGVINRGEYNLMKSVIKLKNLSLKSIIIPRKAIVGFDCHMTLRQIKEEIFARRLSFNRYPIFQRNLDKIIGHIHISDIMNVNNWQKNLTKIDNKIIKPCLSFDINTKTDQVLTTMQQRRIYAAVVKNQKGKVVGMLI